MKNKLFTLMIVMPLLAFGCDSLFDKGDVENTYDGPDQVALFPLENNNNLGCALQSEVVELQFISRNGLADSDVSVSFSAAPGSSARAGTDYSFATSSPVTIPAGSASADVNIDFVVTTLDLLSDGAFDSTRVFGTYDSLALSDGSGTGGQVTVVVPAFGEISAVDNAVDDTDSARVSGTYTGLVPTGGSGSGAIFDVVVPEYGEITGISTDSTDTDWTAGTYRNVPVTGGSGTEATFDITIDAAGTVTELEINNSGFRYVAQTSEPDSADYVAPDILTVAAANIGGTGSDLLLTVASVNAIVAPTVTINETGIRYIVEDSSDPENFIAGDTLTIAAADLGGVGSDLRLPVTVVSQTAAPTVSVVTGGVDYACDDSFTISDADLGAGGAANITTSVTELTGSFEEALGLSEVLLLLQIDASDVKIGANLDSSNVFMAR